MLNVFGKDCEISNDLILSSLTPQTAILGLYNEANDIFKYYIYISREKRILNIDILIANLVKVKEKETNNPFYQQ